MIWKPWHGAVQIVGDAFRAKGRVRQGIVGSRYYRYPV
jgi:hypothetical protein